MKSKSVMSILLFVVALSLVIGPSAFADHHEGGKGKGKLAKLNPAGWFKGEKKGWQGGDVPPGLSEKEAKKAEKEARKKAKEAEKEAKRQKKEADKAAREAQKQAEQAAQQAGQAAEQVQQAAAQ